MTGFSAKSMRHWLRVLLLLCDGGSDRLLHGLLLRLGRCLRMLLRSGHQGEQVAFELVAVLCLPRERLRLPQHRGGHPREVDAMRSASAVKLATG